MGNTSESFVSFVKEQLSFLPNLSSGRLFGGYRLSEGETLFAIIIQNTLYFAVDDTTRPHYEQLGSQCFSYQTKKKTVQVKKYYEVPADILEDLDALQDLAYEAIAVARKLKKVAKPSRAKAQVKAKAKV